MKYACLAFCFFALLVTQALDKKRKIVSPAVVFFGLWSFIFLLSAFGLYGIKRPSTESLLYLFVMCCSFFAGNMIVRLGKKRDKSEESIITVPRWRIIYILYAISIIISLADIILIIKNVMSGIPLWQVRDWILQPYGTNNPILARRSFLEEIIRTVVLTPFNYIFTPLACYFIFNDDDKKRKKTLITLLLIKTAITSISGGGGRLAVVNLAIYILISYQLSKSKNKTIERKKTMAKYKKYIFSIGILALIAVIVATGARTGSGHFFKQFYTYFALPPTLFSIWLPSIILRRKTYGLTTLFGLHSYFFRGLSQVGIASPGIYALAYENITNAEISRNVGYGIANAFVTPAYYFAADGGILFVIIFSLLFGFLCMLPYEMVKMQKRDNLRVYVCYALTIIGIFFTFMRVQTAIPNYILAFIAIPLLIKKEKRYEK